MGIYVEPSSVKPPGRTVLTIKISVGGLRSGLLRDNLGKWNEERLLSRGAGVVQIFDIFEKYAVLILFEGCQHAFMPCDASVHEYTSALSIEKPGFSHHRDTDPRKKESYKRCYARPSFGRIAAALVGETWVAGMSCSYRRCGWVPGGAESCSLNQC